MKTFNVKEFIPHFLQNDRNCYALAMAIQAGVRYMNTQVDDAKARLSDIDSMNTDRLDDMLWEMNLTPDVTITDDEKRAIIRNAYTIAKQAGTASSLRNYLDSYYEHTWVSNLEGDAPEVQICDEGITLSDLYRLKTHINRFYPLFRSLSFTQGDTIGVACSAEVLYNNTHVAIPNVTDFMRETIQKALSSTLWSYDTIKANLTIDGTEKKPDSGTTSVDRESTVVVYRFSGIESGSVTRCRLLNGSYVYADRTMEATELLDEDLTKKDYRLRLFTLYNDEKGPAPTLDMSANNMTAVIRTINSDTFKASLSARLAYTDGTETVSDDISTYSGKQYAQYQVHFTGTTAGKVIRYIELISGDNVLMIAKPENTVLGTIKDTGEYITIRLNLSYMGTD